MTTTHTAAGYGREKKESPLGLLIAVIAEAPEGSQRNHMAAFRSLLRQEGYEDFFDAVVYEWGCIKYSTARSAARPPSAEELREKARQRREARERTRRAQEQKEELVAEATSKAKLKMAQRILNIRLQSGKTVRASTFGELAQHTGVLVKLSKLGQPHEVVGDKLSEDDLVSLLK